MVLKFECYLKPAVGGANSVDPTLFAYTYQLNELVSGQNVNCSSKYNYNI